MSYNFKKNLLFYYRFLIGSIAQLYLPVSKMAIKKQRVKRILVYGHMGIGNMILFVPVIKAFRKHFQNAKISLLVVNNGAEKVVEGGNIVDEVIRCKFTDLSFYQRIKFLWQIKRKNFDLIISNFNGSQHYLALVTLFSRAGFRIGHVSGKGWRSFYDFLYNYKVKIKDQVHEIENNLEIIKKIGIKVISKNPYFHIDTEDRIFTDCYFQKLNINEADILIGIQMGSSPADKWKRWFPERYVELVDILMKDDKVKIIMLGSPQERTYIENAFTKATKKPIIAAGEITLKQTAAVIEKLSLLLCNDSGIMHIGAALGTPLIAIYGPTDFTRTAPIGDNCLIIRKDIPCSPCFKLSGDSIVRSCKRRLCLESITVEEVLRAIKKKLSEKNIV